MKTEAEMRRLLTDVEAARFLAISPVTLRIQRSQGARAGRLALVPYLRFGRAIRYDPRDLERFLQEHRVGGDIPEG